jgi:hypothetical protein
VAVAVNVLVPVLVTVNDGVLVGVAVAGTCVFVFVNVAVGGAGVRVTVNVSAGVFEAAGAGTVGLASFLQPHIENENTMKTVTTIKTDILFFI